MRLVKIIIVIILSVSGVVIMYFALFPYQSPDWVGFGPYDKETNGARAKTLWDWLELLIIPATLGLIGWLYGDYQKQKDNEIAKEKKLNEILESYFKIIENLIVNSDLTELSTNKKSKVIARTRTNLALEDLDGTRKGQILQFLYESKLIDHNKFVDLNGANLKESQISKIVLRNATITGAYFNNSIIENSYLDKANFSACNFKKTSFENSSLSYTNLSYCNLENCNLKNIDLTTVNLEGAKLEYADLRGSKLTPQQIDKIKGITGIKIN